MPPEEQRRRCLMLDAQRACAFQEPVHRRTIKVSGSAKTVGFGESRQQLEVDLLRETTERTVANDGRFAEHAWFEVIRHESDDLRSHVEAVDAVHVQAIQQ